MKMGLLLLISGLLLSVSGVVVMVRERAGSDSRQNVSRVEPAPRLGDTEAVASAPAISLSGIDTPATAAPATAAPAVAQERKEDTPARSSKDKGNGFEAYLADILKASGIAIREWNQGTVTKAGAMGENALRPDFFVAQPSDGRDLEYWIETKWRARFPDGGMSFKPGQLDRYRGTQRESRRKVFLFLGFGGTPEAPQESFWIPLDSVSDDPLTRDWCSRFYMSDPQRHLKGRVHNYFHKKVFKK